MATTAKSILAAESPPFNPQNYQRGGSYGSNPGVASPRSRSNSPASGAVFRGTNAGSTHANTNAVPKYTFQHNGETLEIRNVWAENVEEEMAALRQVVEKYP